MILRRNPWQGHYGAARRKNVDTPSLKGCCQVTTAPYSEPVETISGFINAVPC
jgi:hypothetical protein